MKWKCNLEELERRTKELKTIEELNDFNDLEKKVEILFENIEIKYKKEIEKKKEEFNDIVLYNKELLKKSERKIKEIKRKTSYKVMNVITLIIAGVTTFSILIVMGMVNKHEDMLIYKTNDIGYNKDEPIKYGVIGENLQEGDFKIMVNSVVFEPELIFNSDRYIINITLENISEEDKKITSKIITVKNSNGTKMKKSLVSQNEEIDQIINRGRKATFNYFVDADKTNNNLEVEFGRTVIKLY